MYKEEYKKMIDEVAENACTVTAEDILARANTIKMENGMENKKIKHSRKFVGAAAACAALVLTSTAVFAATRNQEISSFFRNIFHDEITAEIVEEGYLFEIGESHSSEDGKYDVDFVAITGDYYNPVALMDIHVNDESLVNRYDILKVNTFFLGEEEYDEGHENYASETGLAYKDENDDHLYHLSTRGTPYWFQPGETLVIDVCGVYGVEADEAEDVMLSYFPSNTNVECRIVLPEFAVAPTVSNEYEWKDYFKDGDYEFYLAFTEFSSYGTDIRFDRDCTDEIEVTKFEYADGGMVTGQPVNTSWKNIAYSIVLVVDDQEYKPIIEDEDLADMVFYNDENDHLYSFLSFDGINYEEAQHISIKSGDKEIVIK